jgi:hypothetical protein
MSEIFPTRVREGGIAVGAATQWLFGFTLSQVTPTAVNNLGYKAFLMFCCFNWALVLYTWFFIKETKGLSLEEMEICEFIFSFFFSLFGSPIIKMVQDWLIRCVVLHTQKLVFNAKRTPISVLAYRHDDKSSDDDV